MPLTDTTIRKVKPGEKAKRLFDQRGLYLEISPAGGKWWRLKYRFGGREKRLSLGVYPDVPLADARDRCNEARKLLRSGVDPSARRKTEKQSQADSAANSFEIIAREWFAKNKTVWVDDHSERVIRLFERDIFPYLGSRPVSEIEAPELLTVMRKIEARGALDTAHRALGHCWQVFRTPLPRVAANVILPLICEEREVL
jgi:hypothetical protein